jgi:ABC-type amino acid transport substrate-binding protein
MARLLGLTVTWDEVLLGDQVERLRTRKIDAVCAGEAPMVARLSAYLRYTQPIVHSSMLMFVRAGDRRFDGTRASVRAAANRSDLRVAFIDGDPSQEFAALFFPKAQTDELPQTADMAQLYMDVADGKADFVIDDPFTAGAFMQSNPGRLRQVALDGPFAILPNALSALAEDEGLASLLNQGIALMRQRGGEDVVLAPYEKEFPGSLYRVSNGFLASR